MVMNVMIERNAKKKLLELAAKFPVVSVMGPRQSGKTTLTRATFPDYEYVTLVNVKNREFAKSDPEYFIKTYCKNNRLIIDEVQYVPELLDYIQEVVDQSHGQGQFILTGSQNFLLNEAISQTLAGRVGILTLLPLSLEEISRFSALPETYDSLLVRGSYPRVYQDDISPSDFYASYLRTYVERDVRKIKNITNLSAFQRFLKLCAGRVGQLVNWSDLGRDCGINSMTAASWMSLLEASYVAFLLPPYYENFSKRLVKSPKIYFYDTGLASFLLGIEREEQISTHYSRGNLFENLMVSEIYKTRYHQGRNPNCYFWKDQLGHEIDCVLDVAGKKRAVEMKSSRTVSQDFFKNLKYWQNLTQEPVTSSYLVYGGEEDQIRRHGQVLGWQRIAQIGGSMDDERNVNAR